MPDEGQNHDGPQTTLDLIALIFQVNKIRTEVSFLGCQAQIGHLLIVLHATLLCLNKSVLLLTNRCYNRTTSWLCHGWT
jgi:hypothetical protein